MTNKWNYERVRKCTDCRWYSSSSCMLLNEVLPIGVCEAFQKRGCDKEWENIIKELEKRKQQKKEEED